MAAAYGEEEEEAGGVEGEEHGVFVRVGRECETRRGTVREARPARCGARYSIRSGSLVLLLCYGIRGWKTDTAGAAVRSLSLVGLNERRCLCRAERRWQIGAEDEDQSELKAAFVPAVASWMIERGSTPERATTIRGAPRLAREYAALLAGRWVV